MIHIEESLVKSKLMIATLLVITTMLEILKILEILEILEMLMMIMQTKKMIFGEERKEVLMS